MVSSHPCRSAKRSPVCGSKWLMWPTVRIVICQGGAFQAQSWGEKISACFYMVFGGMVLGPVISVVGLAGPPVDAKLLLAFTVAEPMKPHVHGFSTFGLYFAIDDCVSHGVVSLEWSGRLSMT